MSDPATPLTATGADPPPLGTDKRWDVFIAHAGPDAPHARVLYQALAEAGCRPFLDTECLELGCDWDAELASAQRQSLLTVVLISSQAPEATFLREEIQTAIALARKRETRHRVIPIWLDGAPTEDAAIPYGLRIKHGIAISGRVTLQVAAEQIVRFVRRASARRPSLIDLPAALPPTLRASLPRAAVPLGAAAAVLGVRVLGQLAHDARESLVGLPVHEISYPEGELWLTGAKVVLALGRSALFDLWAGVGVERWGAPVVAALAAGWLLLARSRFRRIPLFVLPAVAAVLIASVLVYAVAVGVHHVVIHDENTWKVCRSVSTATDQVAFEVCSWLMNGTAINDGRSGALMGLWAWLFAALCTAGGCSLLRWRGSLASSRLQATRIVHGVLGAACALGAVFLLRQAPRAYALHTWALKYPRVLGVKEPCLPELRAGLLDGTCRVWDVSAGARDQVLLRWGAGCQAGLFNSTDPWSHEVLPRKELERCILETRDEPIFGSR